MKKLFAIVFVAVIGWGCSGSKTATNTSLPEKMELGWMQRSDFMKPAYPSFPGNYDTVHISDNFVEMIKILHARVDIVVVMGTWCGDSKREVPRFLKIADLASISPSQIKFYGVDRTKKSPDGITEKYHIERVPTFIFLKNEQELGRIVESPVHSLEEDMLSILADAQGK